MLVQVVLVPAPQPRQAFSLVVVDGAAVAEATPEATPAAFLVEEDSLVAVGVGETGNHAPKPYQET